MGAERGPSRRPRLFTLEEANALLPRVRRAVEQIRSCAAELARLQTQLASYGRTAGGNGRAGNGHGRGLLAALERAEALLGATRAALSELEAIGCELKDIDLGLVDFRALREGREVYLCWRLGEDEIRFWHELDTGFAGRQPL
jgi:hypothetical protein